MICRTAVVPLVAALLTILTPGLAAAYPQETNNCNDRTLHWAFTSNPLWTSDTQSWVRAAINTLDDERSYDGTRLLTVTEDGGIEVDIKNEPLPGLAGQAECAFGASMWVNANLQGSIDFWHNARHEMFHLAGAKHAGKDDSMNSDNPTTMATCLSSYRWANSITQDDAAYMNWLHNSLSYNQLHANIGFERGFTYWGRSNGSTSTMSSGGATGPGYVRFTASGDEYSSYVYQTVRLWTGDDNSSYRAKINARSISSYDTTRARAQLYRRTLTESGDNVCAYADGLQNPNSETVSSGYVLLAGTSMTTIGTSWTALTSSWVNPSNTDGLQLQIRAYGNSINPAGATNPIEFDNVRGEGQ